MYHGFTISITEATGSRHYALPHMVKRIVVGILLSAAGFVLTGMLIIINLRHDTRELASSKQKLADDLTSLHTEYDQLAGQLDTRDKEFEMLGEKIESLEGFIGLEPQVEQSLQERLALVNATAVQKRLLLNRIPSGYPITYRGITSGFGRRRHPTLNKKDFHPGVDLSAKMNTPVKVTADGVIEYAGYHKKSGFGNLVIVHHDFGFNTFYGHLNKLLVKAGTFVEKGTVIAQSGNSGMSSGPHLHYEIRFIQRALDPTPFMKWRLDNYEQVFKEKSIQWPSLLNLVNLRLTDQPPPSSPPVPN